jgi:hypothetical protein
MTVRELYNWCKACRNKDAEVYMVKDWDQVDENGTLTDLYKLKDINTQYIILDDGLDFVDVPEVLLEFEEERA